MKIRGTTIVTPLSRAAVAKDDVVSKEPWSGKNIVDKLCPSFTETAAMVTCEPVEGYPLEVTSINLVNGATSITRCGKNLLNTSKANLKKVSWIENGKASGTYYGVELVLPPGSYVMKAKPNGTTTVGYIYGRITDLDGNFVTSYTPVYGGTMTEKPITFDDWRKVIINEHSVTIESGNTLDASYAWFSKFDIQIEVGTKATEFEPYNGETFELTAGNFFSTATVPALPGVNNIWADTGEVTVAGKADPTAVINKLTNAIVALGGNV